jgi:hypothetical protein
MNKKPIYIKLLSVAAIIVTIIISCRRDYLDVTEPSAISPAIFPSKIVDLELMLIDVYGRLKSSYFNSGNFDKIGIGLDHTADQGTNGGGFNEWMQNNLLQTNFNLGGLWNDPYSSISRTNALLEALARFRAKGVTADQESQLKLIEGQGLFLRALNYYYLVQFFGEVPVTSEADKSRLAVPLWDSVAGSIAQTNKERATIGAVWDFVIADLQKAEAVMAGKTSWDAGEKARADVWAVKSLLGKAYAFTLQWDKARDKFKEVIDQSGKTLVPYDTYHNMFNGENEFNSESIFEINFTPDLQDGWNGTINTSTKYALFISPWYLDDNGEEKSNGYGNLFIHDKNIRRFGFPLEAVTSQEQQNPTYISQSVALRNNKQVDPRMMVGTLQPYVDSIYINNVWRKVVKCRGGGFDLTDNKAWGHRKYVVLDRSVTEQEPRQSIGINMYVLRLADIYLLYAESLIHTGNPDLGLEYINKVKRRAYGQPVDAPSAIDYTSLTDATMAAPDDHLHNDPLKYERWAELFAEGQWWFDVRRWRIGDKEAAYYQKVESGNLIWKDTKYALPIPESEINNNNKIQKQNEGY